MHPYKVITVDDVWKSVREKETQLLVCQSQDEDVSGEFNLAQFVNQKKYENLGDLDLIQVAKDLFESKKSRLTKEEKEFMDRYGEEVFAFKVNDEILQNHVFYSLPALIQKIRDRNHEILTGFFSQRKREER